MRLSYEGRTYEQFFPSSLAVEEGFDEEEIVNVGDDIDNSSGAWYYRCSNRHTLHTQT